MESDDAPAILSRDEALAVIRELAADSSRIVVIGHARRRGRERSISRRQIERCCQRGTITEGPFRNAHGHWQVSLFRHAAGEEITCVVAIEWRTRLIVVTTF
jgi:hypothetical protein